MNDQYKPHNETYKTINEQIDWKNFDKARNSLIATIAVALVSTSTTGYYLLKNDPNPVRNMTGLLALISSGGIYFTTKNLLDEADVVSFEKYKIRKRGGYTIPGSAGNIVFGGPGEFSDPNNYSRPGDLDKNNFPK